MTASPVLSSVSSSAPMDLNREAATIHCGKVCRQIWPMAFRPNNVVGGIPTIALDYSPYWDAQLFEWTEDAIDQGFRGQLREEFQILTFVQDGLITGPGGKTFGSCRFLHQLSDRSAPRLRVGWLTIERPAISHFDMAGLFIPYLS